MRKSILICIGIVLSVFSVQEGRAMPNFARKLNAQCSMCHTQIPKLNRTGYEYRLAGFRMPDEIGKEDKVFNLGDFFDARIQQQFAIRDHKDVVNTKDTRTEPLEFFEFTMYPLTGSWGKYFASTGEFSMTPDDVFEIENAYVRGAYGDEKGFFEARAGVMHPWEGFGASDRPLGNQRPLFQKQKAIGSPFFLWNLDEDAAEVGYHFGTTGTTLTARISNGIIWKEDGSGVAEPAQGGALSKDTTGPATNSKSWQVFVNQFVTDDSGLSAYFYQGTVPFVDVHGRDELGARLPNTPDTFWRAAFYGNYWVLPDTVNLLAGYEVGDDHLTDRSINTSFVDEGGTTRKFNGANVGSNHGWFGEINYHTCLPVALTARYDWFDPSSKVSNNSQWAWTVGMNYYILHGLQFIADYQEKRTDQSLGGTNIDRTLLGRLIFIW